MAEYERTIDISSQSLEKGEVRDGKQLVAWDCIQTCNDACPIRNNCTYKTAYGVACELQKSYLESLTDMIFSTYRYLNDDMLFKIGMQLVPMYSQLCRQKIVEKSILSLTYEDNKGVTRIHPIYKEIRETIKTIGCVWKDIGFTPLIPDVPAGTPGNKRPGFGDPDHYARISQGADNKRDLIR